MDLKEFQEKVVRHCYADDGIELMPKCEVLTAKHLKTKVGIVVMAGVFTRDVFKAAITEAKAGGLNVRRIYVYADLCTYSGPMIQFCKLSDLGLPAN
jgi:hypothetical protein